MTVVKGSKVRRVRVIEDHPKMRILFVVILLGMVVSGILISHYLGYKEGIAGSELAEENLRIMNLKLIESEQQNKALQQTITNTEIGLEVDQRANETVRQEVIALKKEISELDEENNFYKGLMSPSENRKGLTIGAVELIKTEKPRYYRYKVVIQQLATKHLLLTGNLTFTVMGREGEVNRNISLADISSQYTTENIKLRFKYFQTIAGELQLPEGFEPEGIEVVAASTGKNTTKVKKRFGWLVEEI